MINRRQFIKTSALSTPFLTSPLLTQAFAKRRYNLNESINIGVIGCNGMGWSNTVTMLGDDRARLIGMCDVDQNVLQKKLENISSENSNAAKHISTYKDYRKLLADPNIDAVIIGTPDHWHCKMMIDACAAGKQVYVEKPIANTIEECQLMVAAAEKYNSIVQVGQWQRSGPHYRDAIDIVQSGQLGQIRLVKVWAYQGWMKPVPVVPDSDVPEGVDYKMWLGPAPMRAFNKNRFHFNFRWFWDYAGGLMTDWGVHEIDIALYAMNAKAPLSVVANGGKLAYPDDAAETPDTLQAIFQYQDFNMLWEHATGIDHGPYGRREGIAFIGNNGTLILNRDGYEVLVEREAQGYSSWGEGKMEKIEKFARPDGVNYLRLHTDNFLNAIEANNLELLHTHIESGSVAAINAQMGNIAYKTQDKVFWNASTNSFTNNDAANTLIKANYNNGWRVPIIE